VYAFAIANFGLIVNAPSIRENARSVLEEGIRAPKT
jgi:hypothetical protein